MRDEFQDQSELFSNIYPESHIPAHHPLRQVRTLVRAVLKDLNRSFSRLYSHEGRPSIPPEQLLSALLLQALYGLRSERLLMEQLNYNLLYRWFVGLSPDDRVWDATSFTKNRERLQMGHVRQVHDRAVEASQGQAAAVGRALLGRRHADRGLGLAQELPAQGAVKGGDGSNFHKQKRSNDTHTSTSDPEAELYRKAAGREARLSYMGHAVMENRHGLAVAGTVSQADGTAERRASEALLKRKARRRGRRITVGEDKAYDSRDHVTALRRMNVTPHVAQNDALTKTGRRRTSAIDKRTTRHVGYRISQSCRAMVECIFGWGKQHGTMRKTKHRGIAAVAGDFMLNLIAYNLVRIPKLIAA